MSRIDVVFLDIGGPIYGDRPYYQALLTAIEEIEPDVSEEEFWAEFDACRRDQRGPFTRRLTLRFLPEDRYGSVVARGKELWTYPTDSLQPDVREALPGLAARYRLGVLANQEPWIRETMRRDGIDGFIDVWVISGEVGAEKPDSAIFDIALSRAEVAADRCVMVGDRLDNDIVPAQRAGFRAVWMLRGEASPSPTAEQLAVPDAAVRTLGELLPALDRMAGGSYPAVTSGR